MSLFSSALDPNELTDGVYNIVNVATGQYLDVYDMKYDKNGHVYLYKQTKKDGQDFYLKRQDDGTYIISPQSEKGAYSLSYELDIMEGEFITKKENVSKLSKFSLVQSEEDPAIYTIKPACMTDDKLCLTVSNTKGKYNYRLAGLALENNSAEQKWKFVKVTSESLQIATGYFDVKLGSTYDLYTSITPKHLTGNIVYESSNPEIADVDKTGKVYGISPGQATITVSCGPKSVSTVVNVSPYTAYTWYSQHNMYSGGWYASALKDLRINVGGTSKLFFANGYNSSPDWMDRGCKLCSDAMVLHNLGAVLTTGYDMRKDLENNLEADPFTVAIANMGVTGKNLQNRRVWADPVVVSTGTIAPRFTVDGKAVTVTKYTGRSLKHIKQLLEEHPEGVIVGMYNKSLDSTHYLVFTECLNPNDPRGNYEFRVCDSAASDPSMGDNVPFKECLSYKKQGYRYSSIFGYSVYNVAE
ncbi:MAG: RICIN domain-containing protein [Clostridia bacterium]|nr:RICIN domain-containing protein [Clostridia bacterium]